MPFALPRAAAALFAVALVADRASAQDLEPRRWTHLPIGLNVVGAGFSTSDLDIFVDPVLDIEDARADLDVAAFSYVHSFALGGRSARVDVRVPYVEGTWSGLLSGEPRSVSRSGLGDPRIRFSVNLIGAPPLRGEEFARFRRENDVTTNVGVAFAVTLPLGEYEPDQLINIGANRFAFRPQVGVLHTRGPWSYELTGSVFLFTDNTDFFNDARLQRDPVYTVQGHVTRTFARGWWLSPGAAWGLGGETEVDGENRNNHIGNLLGGVAAGIPLGRAQSLRFSYTRTETLEDVGFDGDRFVLGWSVRF
ncbi:MAG: transporter [Planctomycetota bacterium]